MRSQGSEDVPWDGLSVGATRPAVQSGFNVPFVFLIPILFIPAVIVIVTQNPFYIALIPVLTLLGRMIVAKDHNRPRVLWLSWISGSMLAERRRWGGDTRDPLGEIARGR